MSRADREEARRLPWIDWVGVDVEPASHDVGESIRGTVALSLPLDASQNAQRQRARSHSIELEAQALRQEPRRLLSALLSRLAAFEERGPALAAWGLEADGQATTADRWIAEKTVDPLRAQALLTDVFRTRITLMELRREAGEMACDVLDLTGQTLISWPRTAITTKG